ncbi:MAG: cell division protein FtsA [Prevotellaceae bacterium]|jgi:cell division protein FtsA|nr:cell division protein FtsA [Prevotellaceae bacterium]
MEKCIAAVDLGTDRITVLAGEKISSGKIHILAHLEAPSQGIAHGEVLNNPEVGSVLKSLVNELKQQAHIDITEVYVGVSGRHIQCTKKTSEIRRIDYTKEISEDEINSLEHDMRNVLVNSSSEVLDVIPQVYHIDNTCIVPKKLKGVCGHLLKAEFAILTADKFPMELIQRSVERAGLRLKGLFLSPLAAAEAVLSDDDKNMGVAVVDIGAGTTSTVVYYDDVVRHVAVIPFGGNVITKDIGDGCTISSRYAEQLKVQYGSCYGDLIKENPTFRMPGTGGGEVSFRTLAKTIEARMSEIIEAVEYEIQKSGYADRINAGIVLTGGGAKLGELVEFVQYKTGMKARKGEPLFVTSDSDSDVQRGDCATAVGLLMKGATGNGYMIKEKEPQVLFVVPPVVPPVVPLPPPAPGRRHRKKIKEIIDTIPGMFDGFFTIANKDNRV